MNSSNGFPPPWMLSLALFKAMICLPAINLSSEGNKFVAQINLSFEGNKSSAPRLSVGYLHCNVCAHLFIASFAATPSPA